MDGAHPLYQQFVAQENLMWKCGLEIQIMSLIIKVVRFPHIYYIDSELAACYLRNSAVVFW